MIIGVRDLTWATIQSGDNAGGNGSEPVYSAHYQENDLMVRVDQSEERSDVPFYADDHVIDRDNSVTGATVALELAKITDGMLTGLVGYKAVQQVIGGSKIGMTDEEAPYVGFGFVHVTRYKGTRKFLPYWYYKMQFSLGSRSFNTRGDQTEFQTESLEGRAVGVQVSSSGKTFFFVRPVDAFDTESDAKSWLWSISAPAGGSGDEVPPASGGSDTDGEEVVETEPANP